MPSIDTIAPVPLHPAIQEQRDDPAKIQNAAEQFESLLIAQILRSAHATAASGLGGDEEQSDDAAMGLAEEQFAQALAANGGLGLSKLIVQGIAPKPGISSKQDIAPTTAEAGPRSGHL